MTVLLVEWPVLWPKGVTNVLQGQHRGQWCTVTKNWRESYRSRRRKNIRIIWLLRKYR